MSYYCELRKTISVLFRDKYNRIRRETLSGCWVEIPTPEECKALLKRHTPKNIIHVQHLR